MIHSIIDVFLLACDIGWFLYLLIVHLLAFEQHQQLSFVMDVSANAVRGFLT